MDFVRSYFGTNEPLTSWTLFSSLFGRISADLAKKWGKKCSTGQKFIFTEVTSFKIHILVESINLFLGCWAWTKDNGTLIKWGVVNYIYNFWCPLKQTNRLNPTVPICSTGHEIISLMVLEWLIVRIYFQTIQVLF